MEQEFDFHIWTEQSPISVNDILLANANAHGFKLSAKDTNTFELKVVKGYYGKAVLAYATPRDNPTIVCGAVAYGVYEISMGNRIVNGGIAYTSFVVPAFQGKGVFKRLIQFAQQQCKEHFFSILISFPNSKSIAGYKSAGWTAPDGLLQYMVRPASLKAILRWLWKFNDLRKRFNSTPTDDVSVSECAESIGLLNIDKNERNRFLQNNVAWPVRSEGFYRWRVCELHQSSYGIEWDNDDFIIYRRGFRGRLREIQLLDFRVSQADKNALKCLLKKISKKERADIFTLKISRTHPYFALFKQNTFFSTGQNKNLNFSYLVLDESIEGESLVWAISGLDFHMA